MKKATTIRRIIGITALVLWAVAIVCDIILDKETHLKYQIDVWMYYVAVILSVIYAFVWIIFAPKLHCVLKILIVLCAIGDILFGVFILSFASVIPPDSLIWKDNHYIVYRECNKMIDPGKIVMYERNGILEKRYCSLGSSFSDPDKIDYFFYDDLGFIREEADWSFDMDHWHTTCFYRLNDGHRFDEGKNDSLLNLINKQIKTK